MYLQRVYCSLFAYLFCYLEELAEGQAVFLLSTKVVTFWILYLSPNYQEDRYQFKTRSKIATHYLKNG